jgi:hypothetical protein
LNGTQQFPDCVDDNLSVNINTTQKKNVEGVLTISKKAHLAVEEERNTGQYNIKVATTSFPECEKNSNTCEHKQMEGKA